MMNMKEMNEAVNKELELNELGKVSSGIMPPNRTRTNKQFIEKLINNNHEVQRQKYLQQQQQEEEEKTAE